MAILILEKRTIDSLLDAIADKVANPLSQTPSEFRSDTDARSIALAILLGVTGSYAANQIPNLPSLSPTATRQELHSVYQSLQDVKIEIDFSAHKEALINDFEKCLPENISDREQLAKNLVDCVEAEFSCLE